MIVSSFYELALSKPVMKAIKNMGFEETTPIQNHVIPLAMEKKDIIGQAQTGTGKTAAFGIVNIERFSEEKSHVRGIVVTPTRELAIQVAQELNRLGQYKGVSSLPVYGGQSIERQIRALKKSPQIIVGTPGRLMDHMRRKTIKLDKVEIVTIDEADEMLNMGFIEDIKHILSETPNGRQTLMFSATVPKAIKSLAEKFMKNPETIRIKAKEVTLPGIEQYYVEVKERDKFNVFCRLVDTLSLDKAIVFGRTKRRVDELYQALSERGYLAEGIHGDMTQSKRDSVIKNFRNGVTELLVATDVASRGLDVAGITHIFNFDMPQDTDAYVHRIGRTGRAGESGMAITLVTPREKGHLNLIEKTIKRNISRKQTPTMDDALEVKQKIAVEQLVEAAKQNDSSRHYKLAQELLEDNDSIDLIAGAIKLLAKEKKSVPVKLTEEVPVIKGKTKKQKPHTKHKNHTRKKLNKDKEGRKK